MSSGMGTYRVVSAAEIERQRRAAAEARFLRACDLVAQAEQDIAAARRAYGGIDIDVPRVVAPRGDDAAAFERAATATEAAAQAALAGHDGAVSRARSRAMAASITKVARTRLKDEAATERAARIAADRAAADAAATARARATADAEAVLRAATEAVEAEAARRLDERDQEVERVLARLPAEVEPGTVDGARRAATAALAAAAAEDDAAYAGAIGRLRMAVQGAQDADRSRRENVARIGRLRTELDGLDGPEVAAAHGRLDGADPTSPLPADLAGAVRRAADAARAERDRGFVLGALAETLDELGYETGPGFVTGLAHDGSVVQLPWSGEHGVQVREHEGRLFFNVVRYDDRSGATADVVADTKAEQRFCGEYGRLVEVARQRGFALELAPPVAAGTLPLQHVSLSRSTDRGRDHGAGARVRERRRDA
jgi:hypothetical protein